MPPIDYSTIFTVLGGAGTFAGSLWKGRKLYRAWRERAEAAAKHEAYKVKMIEHCYKELSPNSGSSLKDVINSIQTELSLLKFKSFALTDIDDRAIFFANKAGQTVWANRAYLKLTGRQLEEVLGYGWINVVHPLYRDRVQSEWENAVVHCRNFEADYVYLVGEERVRVHCRAFFDEKNGYFGLVEKRELHTKSGAFHTQDSLQESAEEANVS